MKLPLLATLLLIFCLCVAEKRRLDEQETCSGDDQSYTLIAVSGGLQDGFPDHNKLDYHAGASDEVKAIFIGRALVRGTKAFLDVMQEGWRQYTAEPGQPLINSNVIVSGCQEHANEYWVYAVDSRQVLAVLNNEPRFLSITPDTALVDLHSPRTDAAVRALALQEIARLQKADTNFVALPIVVSTWFNQASYVPSPPVAILDDGTAVTSFEGSLALWADVNDADRICEPTAETTCQEEHDRYWKGIRQAVRLAEAQRATIKAESQGPPFACQAEARLGVGPETARINYPFSASLLVELFAAQGYQLETSAGTLKILDK